jgi:hypothetical protein
MPPDDVLLTALHAQISGAAADWLQAARTRAATGSVNELLRIYTEASKQLGRQPLVAPPIKTAATDSSVAMTCDHWMHEDVGRLLLLTARYDARPTSGDFDNDAIECFQQGDTREQHSFMRTVAWLPRPERFLPIVIDTCRTNILTLFEAVACENPYPAIHFPERNFNQVVLKALFNRIALTRIVGLDARRNPELARMASDYADERRAAGRSVPDDIALAMQGHVDAQRTHV